MKGLTLTQKEQARLQVLNGILEGQISVDEAAEVLGVSERHVWRILAEYRKEGAAALAHGNRGRRANNSIPEEARTQVVALARTRYARVNHTHLTELLAEREEIVLGRSTVRRILVGAGMASPRRRRPPLHRVRRQRMSQEGMLVQVDGSVHAWLEERGPRCTLLLAIDDATSTVPYALFRHEEDTHGYFLLMQELIRRCGVPLALYSDRHAVFKYVPGSHQSPAPTQFGRAMAELGVEQIFARSPEAKGRVERANGTFQDRLVTELRLAGARTISEANQVLWAFLTRFNKRFGVPPAQSTNAYRSPDPDLNLAGILCFKHSRKVARDNTVKYNWHTLQLLPSSERSTYVGAHGSRPVKWCKSASSCCCCLARIHRWTGMDGVRTAEGGEGVTGAMIRARIWVAGRLGGGLQALLGAPMAAYSGCGERDGGIGHGKRRSRTVLARVCGDVGLAGGSVADGRRQAGSGMARSRARARLNCSSQGQRRGRCRVNRRAERVIRPAKAKTRRLRVLVVTVC